MKFKIVIVFFLAVFSSCISLLEVKDQQVAIVRIPGQSAKIKIVYQPSNAAIQSAIQIRKLQNDSEFVLKIFERYNFVQHYQFEEDSLFCVVLKDTISYLGDKPDTFKLNINHHK